VARQQDEIEAILNLIDAIFYGDTGHRLATPRMELCREIQPVGSPYRAKVQAFLSWFGRKPLLPNEIASKPNRLDFIGKGVIARCRRD
jgi:hypothetical protein